MSPPTTIVIPCYNEAERLSPGDVHALLEDPRFSVLLVDDGSTDDTPALLEQITSAEGSRAQWMAMPSNAGKAEAVRSGLLAAIDAGAEVVGYVDADFATPASEVSRLFDEMLARDAQVGMGARVARLGAEIQRSASRHYLGRIFASTASMVLGLAVYDTQCGAKLFRVGEPLRRALSEPFESRWIFDVELIARLVRGPAGDRLGPDDFLEVPLRAWHDVAGSKLGTKGMARAGMELLRLGLRLRRER